MKNKFVGLLTLLILSIPAQAEGEAMGINLQLNGGYNGLGLEAGYAVSDTLSAGLFFNADNTTSKKVKFGTTGLAETTKAKQTIGGAGVYVKMRMSDTFYFRAAVEKSNGKFAYTGKIGGAAAMHVDGYVIPALAAGHEFKFTAKQLPWVPSVLVGFNAPIAENFYWGIQVGLQYNGPLQDEEATLPATLTVAGSIGTDAQKAGFKKYLRAKLNKKFAMLTVSPILNVNLGVNF